MRYLYMRRASCCTLWLVLTAFQVHCAQVQAGRAMSIHLHSLQAIETESYQGRQTETANRSRTMLHAHKGEEIDGGLIGTNPKTLQIARGDYEAAKLVKLPLKWRWPGEERPFAGQARGDPC